MLYILLPVLPLLATVVSSSAQPQASNVTNSYHAPNKTEINNLDQVLTASGVYGFIFNTSQTPADVPYQTYNWCNMPHVRKQEYVVPSSAYQLKYVEVIHRHHKRTPYLANTFPAETQQWDCTNTALYQYGMPIDPTGNASAHVYQRYYYDPATNPLMPSGFPPHTCAFPQITRQGLDDSYQHGKDLYGVYHQMLHLLPETLDPARVSFRATNNPITPQVAGMVISGMFGSKARKTSVPLRIQPSDIDSLEPKYTCPAADKLYSTFATGSNDSTWQRHLTASCGLFSSLDTISGVAPNDSGFHKSYDHYFDNLSARLCHQYPLPCNTSSGTSVCVTQAQADKVFRLGEWEYAWQYRAAGSDTLVASRASFGIWIAEVAANLRAAVSQTGNGLVYRHNVGHDGSVSRLLSVLQLDNMVWPGMGSEVVFELYNKGDEHFVRLLWSGQPLRSSYQLLNGDEHHMIPLESLLNYFDGQVGKQASLVKAECGL